MSLNAVTTAYVLQIGNRYFCGFSKTGRAMTAWSLAGAKTYMPFQTIDNEWLNEDLKKLNDKKKKYEILQISIVPRAQKVVPVELSEKQIIAVAGKRYSDEDEELIRSEWKTLLDNAE